MSNNKQSSVEQLAIALYENGYLQGNGDEIDDLLLYFKAKHEEEHRNTYNQGLMSNFQNFDDYYKETFGGNNEQQ